MDVEDNNLRVASFAVYLENPHESFVDKLTKPSVEIISSSLEFPINKPDHQQTEEMSVFGAERHSLDIEVGSQRMMEYNGWKQFHNQWKPSQVDLQQKIIRSKSSTTPSNWNSQAAIMMRNTTCQNKVSTAMTITSPPPPPPPQVVLPWKSMEVQFGSKEDIIRNLERKLSKLTWDAIPNAPSVPAASTSPVISSLMLQYDEEEEESDEGSCDLFEIDNIKLSGKTRRSSSEYGMSAPI